MVKIRHFFALFSVFRACIPALSADKPLVQRQKGDDQRGECQREQDIGQRIEGERTVRNETVKKIIQEVEHQDSQYGEQQIADDSLDHSGMHSFLCLYHTTDFVERKEFYFKSSVTQAA